VRSEPGAVPGALTLLEGRLAPFAADGVVYVQDQGSQLVARLAAQEGTVLDACAAPGGKSLLIADLGGGRTRVVAGEASRRRVATLARLCERWQASEVRVVAADARRPPFRTTFDVVLLDAPCTGLGTIGRHPDIRWRLSAADVERQARRQAELIVALAPFVRPGGRLVYATCSVEPEENEGVVGPFLEARPDFSPEPLPEWTRPFADGPFVRLEPAVHRGDAFFAASLRRKGLVVT
jgi:16S rRNA (cytosine967-C5)-methyltransferase